MGKEHYAACRACDGTGEYERRHPLWGSPSCPEAYIMVRCEDCDGTGVQLADVDDDEEGAE